MSKNHDIIEIAGEVRLEREKSYLFFDGAREAWVPKAICEWDEKDKTMQMPEWLALEKGLI
jgi:hypothetical protein